MTQAAPVFVPSLLTISVLLLTAGLAHTTVKRRRTQKKEQLGSGNATEQPPKTAPDPPMMRATQDFTPEFLELLNQAVSNAEGRPNWPIQVSGKPRHNGGNVNIIITFAPQQNRK